MSKDAEERLLDLLDAVTRQSEGETTRFGRILDALEERGYGPLITGLSALVVLPTGVIPGVPALIGVCLILLGGQMLLGRARPWFPQRVERFALTDSTLHRAVETARPWAARISVLLSHRLGALTSGPVSTRLIAVMICVAGLVMVPLGFLPGLPFVLGLATLLTGLGMTARDGVVILVAYALFGAGLYMGWQAL